MKLVTLALLASAVPVSAGQLGPDPTNPIYLQDRGTGVSTSMFGTYVRQNELIVYPFYEYYRDANLEYKPEEYGAPGDVDYRGRYRAHENLVFVGFGLVRCWRGSAKPSTHSSRTGASRTPSAKWRCFC